MSSIRRRGRSAEPTTFVPFALAFSLHCIGRKASAEENRLDRSNAIRACRRSAQPRAAAVLFRKMALEVAAIVKNAGHLDHAVVAAAIEKKMARLLHP
jgi:hypothetical protein